jgi:hypothetical protein
MRRNRNLMMLAGAVMFLLIIYIVRLPSTDRVSSHTAAYRYPYQPNYHSYSSTSLHYNFMIISDMDKASKSEKNGKPIWQSKARFGTLIRDPHTNTYSVTWQSEVCTHSNPNNTTNRTATPMQRCHVVVVPRFERVLTLFVAWVENVLVDHQ